MVFGTCVACISQRPSAKCVLCFRLRKDWIHWAELQ